MFTYRSQKAEDGFVFPTWVQWEDLIKVTENLWELVQVFRTAAVHGRVLRRGRWQAQTAGIWLFSEYPGSSGYQTKRTLPRCGPSTHGARPSDPVYLWPCHLPLSPGIHALAWFSLSTHVWWNDWGCPPCCWAVRSQCLVYIITFIYIGCHVLMTAVVERLAKDNYPPIYFFSTLYHWQSSFTEIVSF